MKIKAIRSTYFFEKNWSSLREYDANFNLPTTSVDLEEVYINTGNCFPITTAGTLHRVDVTMTLMRRDGVDVKSIRRVISTSSARLDTDTQAYPECAIEVQ